MYVFARPSATIIMMHRLLLSVAVALAACAPGEGTPQAPAEVQGPATAAEPSPGRRSPSDRGPVVVFLGTSLTAGLGLEDADDAYVFRLAEIADSAGLPFRAVNAGVSGETSAGGLRRIDWVLREPLDVLVLELGANDGLRGLDPAAMRSNLLSIIEATRTRDPDARVIVVGMEAPPNLGEAYTEAFRTVFSEVAEAEDAALVPFLLEGVAGVPELNQPDGIHPTAEGHLRLARTVWPTLRAVLTDLGRSPAGAS